MTRQRREPRPPRPPRTRRRNYDPDALWAEHGIGAYAEPGTVLALANDANALVNVLDALHAVLWASWRIVRRRDGVRSIFIPANDDYSVNDVRSEWRRLHIDSCIVNMSNSGMRVWVGAKQERWARYVLGRLLSGERVPAWKDRA